MPEPITRRRFLRDTAILSGAIAIAEPAWASRVMPVVEAAPKKPKPSAGRFASVVDHEDGSPVEWLRLGGDVTMTLTAGSILVGAPHVMHEVDEILTIDEFGRGLGHHEIARDLGEPALSRLRDEIAYRAMLPDLVGRGV